MTTLAASIKRGGFLAPMVPSPGLGCEADMMQQRLEQICISLWQPVTLRRVAESTWDELQKAAERAIAPNWDGYGALPFNADALAQAARFLAALPTTTDIPEVSVDPDGEIAISWDFAVDQVFSVSVGPNGRLAYAGLFGTSKVHGTEWFFNEIPKEILDNITRVLAAFVAGER